MSLGKRHRTTWVLTYHPVHRQSCVRFGNSSLLQQNTLPPRLHWPSLPSVGEPPQEDQKRCTSPSWHWPLQSAPPPRQMQALGAVLVLQQIGLAYLPCSSKTPVVVND